MFMPKVIKNDWHHEAGEAFEIANILNHDVHPEGLDVDRIRFFEFGNLVPNSCVGNILSVLRGSGRLHLREVSKRPVNLEEGVHIYLPPGMESFIEAEPGTEFLRVSSPSASQTRGKQLLLRDETFLAASASGSQSLRWIFTPQYLSRRIFLRHDPILLSKSGNPVSWFRTTMFDVIGLPKNEDGESVFKMSYNSRTEFNVCYDVRGMARVRMALHPYKKTKQSWIPWIPLDGDSTYHLNEAAGGTDEESCFNEATKSPQLLRNKHEVHIVNGYVTLFCLFDPSPVGIECHQPGEYSDYKPLSQVLGTKPCEIFQREMAKYDKMIDSLSLAKAMGVLTAFHGTPIWDLYLQGREAQAAIEAKLTQTLALEGNGRERVLECWMQHILA
jgi:hypothetical protein